MCALEDSGFYPILSIHRQTEEGGGVAAAVNAEQKPIIQG